MERSWGGECRSTARNGRGRLYAQHSWVKGKKRKRVRGRGRKFVFEWHLPWTGRGGLPLLATELRPGLASQKALTAKQCPPFCLSVLSAGIISAPIQVGKSQVPGLDSGRGADFHSPGDGSSTCWGLQGLRVPVPLPAAPLASAVRIELAHTVEHSARHRAHDLRLASQLNGRAY